MAKGIRVNQLAKELGVESKSILAKCRDEGLDDKVPNHQSTISLGLAETIREWHKLGLLGSAGEGGDTALAVETLTKKKSTKFKKKSDSGDDDSAPDDGATAGTQEPDDHMMQGFPTPVVVQSDETPVEIEESLAVTAHEPVGAAPVGPTSTAPETLEVFSPVDASLTPPPAASPNVITVPAMATPPTPIGAAKPLVPHQPARPTVKLDSGRPMAKPGPRPMSFVPAPAQLQGPKVVREEKPDVVAAPRARRPGMTGPGPSATGVVPARAQGGRGVKSVGEEEETEEQKKAKLKGAVSVRRGGNAGRRGEADEKLRDFSEQDLKDRADRINSAAASRHAVDAHVRRAENRGTHIQAKSISQKGEPVEIEEPITVRSLAAALGVKAGELIGKLMRQGVFAAINQALEFDAAVNIAGGYSVELVLYKEPTLEEKLMGEFDARAVTENMVSRPAVVTILGHVDHGKTSLLDKIRSANVAAGEAGGITQHIAAWQVTAGGKKVTFIDTPGHQAFTAMRARGANMTDVVVLVVDAAQGIQPQTTESINHAKAAGVPIVVAMSKIDRADANPDMVLGQLAGAGLNPVEWGGDTEVVRCSAVTGAGIDDLIEILDYQSQLRDLKADPVAPARGTVIESRVDQGLGPIATVLVQDGTLKIGDVVLAGQGYGRVRSLLNDHFKQVSDAPPSMPIIISGLSQLPSAGDKFYAVEDMERARSIAQERSNSERADAMASQTRVSLDNLFSTIKEGDIKTINLIIKADVQGSVETLTQSVTDQNTDEVRVKVIHAAVGPISESDVELANASGAVIIGFNAVPEESARALAEQRRVEVRLYKVIYEIFDDLKKALSGMLTPEIREKLHGHAEVRQIFKVSRLGNIAGCMITDGHIQRGSKMRVFRDGKMIVEDLTIDTLKRLKDDVKEVKTGFECGIKLSNFDDIKIGDRLEAYIRETFQRTL